MVLKGYRVTHLFPCLSDPGRFRAIVELDEEIHETFAYINSLLNCCIYTPPFRVLFLKKDGKIIILYPRKVTVARAMNGNDVKEIMEWLKTLTQDVFTRRDRIKPDYTSRIELDVLDILQLLPGMDCRVCDELTCQEFAIKLLESEKSIVRCGPLFTSEYKEKRQLLLEILAAAGYTVPGTREQKNHS